MYRTFQYAALLLFSSGAFGATENNVVPSHGRDIWDAAAGFPGGYVYGVAQTADGYIWIGTSKGLVRYDGLNFLSIRKNGSGGEAKFPVLGVLADSNDQLWATDDRTHLYRYVDGQLVGPLEDNGKHQFVTGLLGKTRDGSLVFVSELQGLVEYEQGSARVLLDPSLTPRSPTAVAEAPDGAIWIATRQAGLYRMNLGRGTPELQHFPMLTNVKVNCLLPVGDSALLIGTDKGLLNLHNGKLTQARPELGTLEIFALIRGGDGDVWIGTEGRVFKAHANDIDREGTIRALENLNVHGTVTTLFEDRDGDLWIGGPEVIERYRASGFTTYSKAGGMPCGNCGAIYVDHHDRVWFAPWDGGLFVLSQGSIRAIESAGLKRDTVYSVAEGADGEVWLGRRNGGITRLSLRGDALRATTYTGENGPAENSVYVVYRAADGSVWAGTLHSGLSRFRAGTWHTFTTQDGLPSNTISGIAGNSAGDVFVGTPSGLAVLRNNHWIAYTAENGLPPGAINRLFVDDSGTLWIGTAKGIAFLQSGAVHVPLGAPDALYGEILGIAESRGWLWITTRDHVLRVKPAALLNQSFSEGDYREFGVAEGLPSTEGVKRRRTVVGDDRGRIWFSLNKGISVLEPSAFAKPAFPVTIRGDEILVDGRAVPLDKLVHIPAGRHRLGFRYFGVNVSNPDGVRYRYRLDDVDPGWSEPTALREIDYTNIPPGEFRFHVMARNPDGLWNSQETTIAFEVAPASWQTRWFQVGSGLAVLLFVFGLYRLRVVELHQQFNAALDARVNERTRIARELHDTLLQSFHGLMFQFQAARNLLPQRAENEKATQVLDGAIGATEQAIAESRDAIHDLRPQAVSQADLAQLLTTAGQELAALPNANHNSPAFQVIVEGEPKTLAPMPKDEVYRIAREVIRNAFRHAGAHRIEVEIRYDRNQLRLRLRDDGKGMDAKGLKESKRAGHWGLPGIRERAQRIGSRLDFWSEAGAGTEVELTVPAAIAYERAHDSPRFTFPRGRKS